MDVFRTLEGALGIGFFLFCTLLVLLRIELEKKFQTIDYSVLSMGVVYGLLLPIVVHGASEVDFQGSEFIIYNMDIIYVHTFSATIGVIGLLIGWYSVNVRQRNYFRGFFQNYTVKTMTLFFYMLLGFAFLAVYLYTYDYGGFFGYFEYNRYIRSGIFDGFQRSRFSFLWPFGSLAVVACIGFWGLILSGKRGPVVLLGFFSSFLFASYVLYASLGRVSMVVFAAVFPFSVILKCKISPIFWFIFYIIAAVFGVMILFVISNVLGIKGADNIYVYISREASFLFVSFFANLMEGDKFNLFWEIALFPAYLLPSSWTSSWLSGASDVNTKLIMGFVKGEGGVTGAIPTDMLTFGLMQMHLFGVVIYSFILGFFIRMVAEISQSFALNGMSCAFLAYIIMRIGVFSLFYSYPKHIVSVCFPFIVIIVMIFAFRIIKRMILGGPYTVRVY